MAFRLTWPGASLHLDDGLVDIRVEHGGRWLVVRDDEAPAPVDGTVRTHGLWLTVTCETPGEHWSVGLEAFAIAVDDPDDERGDLVPLGLDIEWEAPDLVHGEVLVGDEVLPLDTRGDLQAG